jgi:hypothetical protein
MKRPKFRGWSKRVERNILAVYLRSSTEDRENGLFWYSHTHEIARGLSVKFDISVESIIGVIAAMSPGNQWGRNILDAETLISEFSKGARGKDLPVLGVYGRRNIVKSERILLGMPPLEVLGGQKVISFYQNILAPKDSFSVTIDRHAKALAYAFEPTRTGFASSDMARNVGKAEYRYLAKHYRVIAERLGLVPNQLQAITWVTWRRLLGRINEPPDWIETSN